MKKVFFGFATAALLLVGYAGIMTTQGGNTTHSEQGKKDRVLRHVVLFKFKDGSAPEDLKKIEDAFRTLPEKIPQIAGFEWGTDASVENLAQGFTHCFFVTFRSEEDRDAYLPHPAHKEFGTVLRPHLDKVLVIDYWTRE